MLHVPHADTEQKFFIHNSLLWLHIFEACDVSKRSPLLNFEAGFSTGHSGGPSPLDAGFITRSVWFLQPSPDRLLPVSEQYVVGYPAGM